MATIKEGLKVVKGYESIANIIEVMPDDAMRVRSVRVRCQLYLKVKR